MGLDTFELTFNFREKSGMFSATCVSVRAVSSRLQCRFLFLASKFVCYQCSEVKFGFSAAVVFAVLAALLHRRKNPFDSSPASGALIGFKLLR